jgi:hypothetical protein
VAKKKKEFNGGGYTGRDAGGDAGGEIKVRWAELVTEDQWMRKLNTQNHHKTGFWKGKIRELRIALVSQHTNQIVLWSHRLWDNKEWLVNHSK